MENEAFVAAREGKLEKLKELLDRGININAQDDNGDTLLHHTARNSQYEVLLHLLQSRDNVDVLITNNENQTVLHVILTDVHEDIAKIFVILIFQCARRDLRKLLDTKIKANGNSALHVAAKYNVQYYNAGILLEYGANYEMKNDAGEKPVDIANAKDLRTYLEYIDASFKQAKNGDHRFIDELLIHCLSNFVSPVMSFFNCRNNEGHTIVQILVLNDHCTLIPYLLKCRYGGLIKHFHNLNDQNRRNEFEKLIKIAGEFRDYWHYSFA